MPGVARSLRTLGDNLCAAGAEVESLILQGKSDDYLTYGGFHFALGWLKERFAGEPMVTTCGE